MALEIRPYREEDLAGMIKVWNEVVEAGEAFPQSSARGLGLGRELVKDSLSQAARKGFRGLQFNAVVASNEAAIHLYEDLGFTRVGTIPGGFCSILGNFEDMHIYYKDCFGAALPS